MVIPTTRAGPQDRETGIATVAFPVTGMTCAACAARVQRQLERGAGVTGAWVNYGTERATVKYDPSRADTASLIELVREAGYGARTEVVVVAIEGLEWAATAEPAERLLAALPGVISAGVNLATGEARVELLPDVTSAQMLEEAIVTAGYRVASPIGVSDPVERERRSREREYRSLRARFRVAAVAGVVSMIVSLPLMAMGSGPVDLFDRLMVPLAEGARLLVPWLFTIPDGVLRWLLLLVTTPVLLWSGRPFFRGAYSGLLHGTADMNTLIALGTGAAYGYSVVVTVAPGLFRSAGLHADVYFEAVSVIVALILLGKMLESRAKARTSAALRGLASLVPKTAHVIRAGIGAKSERLVSDAIDEVEVERLEPGMLILIRPGERVPADGIVQDGRSAVDESIFTGEPMPVEKAPGSEVVGGTINGEGALRFRATRVGRDTALAQIVRLVQEAQATRPPIQRLADRIAGVFVPIVVLLAFLAAVVWLVVGPSPAWLYALVAFVTVLIIACPCAMGLATPTAVMVGTGGAAERGILFRGGESLELAGRVRTVVLDKTGTITEGRPSVRGIVLAASPQSPDESRLLQLAASLEHSSEHPLASAIVAAAKDRGLALIEATEFTSYGGRGIEGRVDGRRVVAGNASFMERDNIDVTPMQLAASRAAERGHTVVYMTVEDQLAGLIEIADALKPDSREAIARLRLLGTDVVMLTGDSEGTAKVIAKEVGIDHVIAQVLPADKARVIDRLKRETGQPVAMVGDGVNDAPALASADVGIAIGTGADIAVEASDVTLTGAGLSGVVTAIRLSRRTLRVIRQNLFWAFIYNVLGIPIAAGVLYPAFGILLSPVFASAAMAISSVSVVGNSLRLRRQARTA